MTVNKRFAKALHKTANARKAFKAVNPYADDKAVNQAADRLMESTGTEDDMLELLAEEKQEAEAGMAGMQEVKLYTLKQQRAVLARIISGQYRAPRHVKIRNLMVEVYDAPTIAQVMQAVALDARLAKEQRALMAAVACEEQPETVTLPATPAYEPEAIDFGEPEPSNLQADYMPIMQKIALREQQEASLTVEERLQRDYEDGERYKQQQREARKNKKSG